ncbi:hypothetical protein Gpo141_00000631 [Globisporangium polare]
MKRAPTATSALSFKSSAKALVPKNDVDNEHEKALLSACAEGDVAKARRVIEKIQRQLESTAKDAIEELFACVFARAAGCNHVAMMEFLLALEREFPSLEFVTTALRYGVCRSEKYFPPVAMSNKSQMQCCFALRYVGYAAVMCVEHNAVGALRFVVERSLLEDVEAVRTYRLAKQKAIHFNAPNPGAYRPMLMLLITTFPSLLQICSAANASGNPILSQGGESEAERHMKALESSLVYEYKVNQANSITTSSSYTV